MLEYKSPVIIAEIGCNHMGDFSIAKELITLAHSCGAKIAKFQKRNSSELLTPEQYAAPHPNPNFAYGKTYGEHREFLEFSVDQHAELKKYCESIGIEYSTSVWDVTSAREMVSLNPKMLKVPSACNNHMGLLRVLRDEFKGKVHISFGMTTKEEEKAVIDFFEETGQARDRLVIYSCTSGYPVQFEDVCLLELLRLKKEYDDRVLAIAFSGHHLGIAIDVAAYVLGAEYIERHFTKNRTWKGTDHSASLEPGGLGTLVRDLEATRQCLRYKDQAILPVELEQRDKLKYREVPR